MKTFESIVYGRGCERILEYCSCEGDDNTRRWALQGLGIRVPVPRGRKNTYKALTFILTFHCEVEVSGNNAKHLLGYVYIQVVKTRDPLRRFPVAPRLRVAHSSGIKLCPWAPRSALTR